MRALTPRSLFEEAGAQAIVDRFADWFGDQDRVERTSAHVGRVVGRGALTYRLRTRDAEGTYEIVQHAFLDARDGHIHRIDLLCSGFAALAEGA